MTEAYIGLGGNVGDRLAAIDAAIAAVDALEGTSVLAVSPVYESEPWGVSEQPPFANAVARVSTSLSADRLLAALKEIETALGRTGGPRFGPRPIDCDILLFGDEEWDTPALTIPHPRLRERAFAVRPLLDIAPDARWPDGSAITLAEAVEGRVTGVVRGTPSDTWVEVASSPGVPGKRMFDARALFIQSMLDEEGIRFAWDPFPPTEDHNPWGFPRKLSLLVPASDAGRARRLIADLDSTPSALVEPDEPPDDAE